MFAIEGSVDGDYGFVGAVYVKNECDQHYGNQLGGSDCYRFNYELDG